MRFDKTTGQLGRKTFMLLDWIVKGVKNIENTGMIWRLPL